jgi:putative two-component system response regulator
MTGWIQWAVVSFGAWLVAGTAAAFLIGRIIGAGSARATIPVSVAENAVRSVRPRVLVVDDDAPLRSLLLATLAAEEFDVREAGSAEEAIGVIRFWRPELVLLDVSLPGMDGLTFSAELARSARDETAVILLTGEQISTTTARLAGAKTVISKPFSPLELLAQVDRVLRGSELEPVAPRRDEAQLMIYARDLASIARTERRQRLLLQDAYEQTAMALADAVDVRDRSTGLHAQRVQRYALDIARFVDDSLLEDPSLEYGFLLHDVGKIAISDHVLLKDGPLTDEERELVRAHPTIGAQILRNVALLQGIGLDVVRHHHERWDGAGYPDGLAGNAIPLGARIFAVADTLDAMTSDRPYRSALPWDEAVEEIRAHSGRQFDPDVVTVFAAHERELRAIYEGLSLVA